MITVRLYTGQVLTFPDGTDESVMRAAAERVLAGEHDTKPKPRPEGEPPGRVDLSHLRREPGTFDLSHVRPTGEGTVAPVPVLEGPPSYADLVERKRRQMAYAREHGDLGRVPGGTPPETILRDRDREPPGPIRRAIQQAGNVNLGYRALSTGLDVVDNIPEIVRTLPEAARLSGATAADANTQVARLSTLPRRVAAGADINPSMRELLLEEKVRQGTATPEERLLLTMALSQRRELERETDPMKPVAEMTSAWRDKATEELAEAAQELPEDVAAGIFHQASMAGMLADASQYVGARSRPFGVGERALTEAEQAAVARSGRYLPGADEPLIYRDPENVAASGVTWKGAIPDWIREKTGQPWRRYGETPLERPTSSAPRPRSMDRDPLSIAIEGGSPEERKRILRLWDYASRRYPRLTAEVPEIRINPKGTGAGMSVADGSISLSADADLGSLMHELTHVAQRVKPTRRFDEAYSTRMSDVYSRIPEPQTTRLRDIGEPPDIPGGPLTPRRPFDISEATESPDLGIRTLDPGERLFVAVDDATGRDIGSLIARQEPDGGFRVRHVFVDEAHRGKAIPEDLYRQAHQEMGPYLGSTDYLGRRTAAGERTVERLRETAPEIFEPPAARPRTPEILSPEYTAADQMAGRMRPEDVAPPNYSVHRTAAGIEVSSPGGRIRTFRGPQAETEASRWLDAENDRLMGIDEASERLNARLEPIGTGTAEPVHVPGTNVYTYSPEIAADAMTERLRRAGFEPEPPPTPEPLLPSPATQAVRLAAAEQDEFLRPPLPFRPAERGSIGPPDVPVPGLVPDDLPSHLRPLTPDEAAAEAMGWKLPTRAPRSTQPIDPIRTPQGQTNIAAQVGGPESGYFGDPEIAGYVIQRSDEVFKAKGPMQTWDTLEEMATRLGTSKEELLSRSSHWNVLPPEARLRLTYVIKGNEDDIASLQSKLVSGMATDADKTELLRHIDTREDLIKLGAQTGSAYGRALNSLKIEARLALGDDVLLRQKLYRQYSKQLDNEKPLMQALARLDPNNPEELQAFLRTVNKPKWYEYAHEYWISSILSAPTSHLRNLIGNSVNSVMENAVVRPVAAGFDAARAGADTASREIFLRETPAAVVGLGLGIRQGVRRGLEVIRRGYDPVAMQGKLFPVRSAFARSQNRVVREVVGPVVTFPLRMLAASDAVFKTMNWTAEIYAQAARIATKEGLAGKGFAARTAQLIGNPTDDMIEAADSFALKATFNDPASAIGKQIMGLRDLPGVSSANPGVQLGIEGYRAGMGFILPFVKIADRLMVRGFEYTPLGAVSAIGARKAGNFASAADLAARSAIGSTILAYAASLAMEGRLTAGAPTDEAEKAAFYGANKQPWSVRTDDGVWIPFAGLQPVGTAFALAAAAWKGWQEHGDAPTIEQLGHAAGQVGAYVTDQSYMDGLAKFMDAISGSERERGRAFSDLATNTAWGFSPFSGLTRSVARAVDPRVIDAESIADRLKQNVPGVSLGMDARLTPWGEDVVPTGGRLRPILPPGSILLPSKEEPNPLDQELERLGLPLGYVGKTIADRFGTGRSRGDWKLDQKEWYLYQQTAGRATKLMLERLYAKPGYPEWDVEVQRERTQQAIEAARKYARIIMVRYHRGQGLPALNPTYGTVNAAANPPQGF